MRTFETTAVVGNDRKITLQLPPEVAPGPHQIVLVVDGPVNEKLQTWTTADWPIHDAGGPELHHAT
jgi:hypothetical protein